MTKLGFASSAWHQRRSELLTKDNVSGHSDLIGRNPALEEVREFLHVLKLHEGERIARAEDRRDAEGFQAAVRDVFEIFS